MPDLSAFALHRFGVIRTDRLRCAPLDEAVVSVECADRPDATFAIEVTDGAGRVYHRQSLTLIDGQARFTVIVAGTPGLHVIRAHADGSAGFGATRMGAFQVIAETAVQTDDPAVAAFVPWLRDALQVSADRARYGGRWVWGDKCGDNSPANLAYPRFRLDAAVYLEPAEQLKGALDLIYAHQQPDGSLFDHIYGDIHPGWGGERCIRSMMADLEIGSIINVHQVWLATGDDDWARSLLDPMRRGWAYATGSADLWSAAHGLIQRPHTPDEWDFQTGDGSCFRNEQTRFVIACCDAVRLPKAADALAAMLTALGRADEADSYREFATAARARANALLWDGTKYQHHVHVDGVPHDDFDERAQLAMSNTWACNDGLADQAQAAAILAEYERRLHETGDRYPWWTLQPGYPEGWFPGYPPGMYANGGLFPWVGGELCRACFGHGQPERGWRLFRELWSQVSTDGGALVTWYTRDGQAAANTYWTTNHDAWGIAAWGRAVIEGLVGVRPLAPALARCACTPQWAAGGVARARACVALPASHSYFAYDYQADGTSLRLRFTGSGEGVELGVPLLGERPWRGAHLDGQPVPVECVERNGQRRLSLVVALDGPHLLELAS